MAKGFLKSLWDKVSGEEQARLEAEEQERRRQQAEQIARDEERARQQRIAAQRLKDYSDELYTKLYRIEQQITPGYNDPSNEYKAIWALKDKASENKWLPEYAKLTLAHTFRLRQMVVSEMNGQAGLPGLCTALSAASCIKCFEMKSEKAAQAADILFQMVLTAMNTGCYLDYGDYGQCKFLLDSSDEMKKVAAEADDIMNRLTLAESSIANVKNNKPHELLDVIITQFGPQVIQDACKMMWFYAKQWPFDVNAFEKARKLYVKYTAYYLSNPNKEGEVVEVGPVEEVLARVYAKNKIGGIGTAKQEKPYIDLWLSKKLELGDFDPCYVLAHGLAWMELYELEIDILRRLIQAGADVPPQLQDRLTFLENGGTEDVKVYDIEPFDNIFFFDSSVPEWTNKDLSAFFRKIAMKKTRIQYSLALAKWTKTLPLASGQKVSRNQLFEAFQELVDDFDGEVFCELRNAAAINLSNVVFPNAVLFTFKSLRNRCVDILFYCEKFGRNLNLTIFTLFTPDAELDFEELERYCLAIKDNMYVESFRESILQVVDEAIKVKQTVYDDDDAPRKKMVFDE